MSIFRYIPFLLLCSLFFACNSSNNQVADDTNADMNDFDNFYKKFHRDSAFQMNHILFPLEGIPSMADSSFIASGKKHYWNKKDWTLHNELDFENNPDYTRELQLTDFLVEERIFDKYGFFIMRRFYFMEDKWMLIYYSDLNPSDRKKKPIEGEEKEEEAPQSETSS